MQVHDQSPDVLNSYTVCNYSALPRKIGLIPDFADMTELGKDLGTIRHSGANRNSVLASEYRMCAE
ncbi:hypothetical protein JCM31598_36760 [Desulfonatronum parangueonense]